MPIDYTQTWIYKVACKDPAITDFYLGYSTFTHERLNDMLRQRCKKDKWHVCAFIREHGGFENFHIVRLASKTCTSSMEARTELRKHFDASPPSLNKQIPTRTRLQYAKTEPILAQQKAYREVNRDKIRQDQQDTYIRNKERISISRKAYYQEHGERIREHSRARRRELKRSGLDGPATADPPAGS
jgi:hypothetical protein